MARFTLSTAVALVALASSVLAQNPPSGQPPASQPAGQPSGQPSPAQSQPAAPPAGPPAQSPPAQSPPAQSQPSGPPAGQPAPSQPAAPPASSQPAGAPPAQQPASSTSSSIIPLASKNFTYPNLPYQADPDDGVRGTQSGYNMCNSTTENQDSLCQTSFLNSVDDFCLWAPPTANQTIGDTEANEVAWCTKPGHGTRLIPQGALQGVQFMRTPDYVQVVGFIDQQFINIASDDYGGELDPHGADFRGNPLGGLFYSNSWSNGNNDTYEQVHEWHNFMGGNAFCLKACDPAGPNAAHFCEHIYDRIGCAYNAPNNAQNGTFESCQGDNQDYPGVYTDGNGQVQTYTQPPESLGAITTMPYTPKVPASSNCITYTSAALYTGLPSPSALPQPSTPVAHSQPAASPSAPRPSQSNAVAAADSGASAIGITSLSTVLGVAFAVAFLA